MTTLSDIQLLDALKDHFGMTMDSQLCDLLNMSPSQISQVRAEGNPRTLTLMQKLVACDYLGYAWARDALLTLVPEHLAVKLRAMDIAKTKASTRRARGRAAKSATTGEATIGHFAKEG